MKKAVLRRDELSFPPFRHEWRKIMAQSSQATILPDPTQVELVRLTETTTGITVVLRACVGSRPCPVCGTRSERMHSRYVRQVADLPWLEIAVCLQLQVRRFFCDQPECPRTIFTERLPGVVAPYARRTVRLARLIELVGFLLGGNAGSRLLRHLANGGLPGSRDTVLRAVRRAPLPAPEALQALRVLSVDDFAFRRGATYGTILVDLERHRVVDLLSERSDVAFARWLRGRAEVRQISRDRGGDYAAGATLGAPQAEQIADRFHLLVNAGEALERCLTRHHASLRDAAQSLTPHDAPERTTKRTPTERHRKEERRAARQRHYEQVMELCAQGVSAHQIARQLGIARGTVAKFLRAAAFPEMASHPRPRMIDPYLAYLRERWDTGEHNARTLWKEIRSQGYPASDIGVRRLLSGWRSPAPQPGVPGIPLPAKDEVLYYSTHKTRWLLSKPVGNLSRREAAYIAALTQRCPPIAQAQQLLATFRTILTQRQSERIDAWLDQCAASGISELVGFARALRRDYLAVQAAVRSPWSQGPIEGHVNRLKLLKRQMYGRAKFDLLRQRVLFPSTG
ncbi:MAG: ISL3 family transposase [Nitrososphaerota archaeon]